MIRHEVLPDAGIMFPDFQLPDYEQDSPLFFTNDPVSDILLRQQKTV